jgi:SAM-dependent methyltransferase
MDRLFHAPGRWNLYACDGCGTAYLDPRPDRQTIHLAYRNYVTHQGQVDDDPQQPGTDWPSSLKQAILRAYIRRRFGHRPYRPSDVLAGAMWLRPWLRLRFDGAMRHLPSARNGNTLLDIGCGNGRFLAWARVAGWSGCGTEPDPLAASSARAKGFDVHDGPLDALVQAGRKFDAITISHVIEHVHEPAMLLRTASRLLRPGGYFWIETPNVDAHGHACFGAGWRGLHPPQHLQLFAPDALRRMLGDGGFVDIRLAPWQPNWQAMASQSRSSEPAPERRPRLLNVFGGAEEGVGRRDPGKREFITLTATVST